MAQLPPGLAPEPVTRSGSLRSQKAPVDPAIRPCCWSLASTLMSSDGSSPCGEHSITESCPISTWSTGNQCDIVCQVHVNKANKTPKLTPSSSSNLSGWQRRGCGVERREPRVAQLDRTADVAPRPGLWLQGACTQCCGTFWFCQEKLELWV